jgi:hypothetical protein
MTCYSRAERVADTTRASLWTREDKQLFNEARETVAVAVVALEATMRQLKRSARQNHYSDTEVVYGRREYR